MTNYPPFFPERPESVLWLGQIVPRLRWLWDQGGVWRGVLLAGGTRVLCSHDRSGLCSIVVIILLKSFSQLGLSLPLPHVHRSGG